MTSDPLLGPAFPEPGSYDSPDQTAEQRRAAEISLREDRLKAIEAAILSTTGGREWLWGLLNTLHVFEQRIAMTASDYENGFWAGERESGIRMLRKFAHVNPENFARMFIENDKP